MMMQNRLHHAVIRGSMADVEKLVKDPPHDLGIDDNGMDDEELEGHTAVTLAAKLDKTQILKVYMMYKYTLPPSVD